MASGISVSRARAAEGCGGEPRAAGRPGLVVAAASAGVTAPVMAAGVAG
jgi:hypothetical protein